ncbi:unnamed protein product [Rotaria sp. Silwood1]|nr:unnamed protein product [Rotaria sp. Silwood1]
MERIHMRGRRWSDAVVANSSFISLIIKGALKNDINAIHPDYGFLSANGDFAKACIETDIMFIGLTLDVIY